MSTTPIASAHVCTPKDPPRNWVGNIVPGIRCSDVTAKFWDCPSLAGTCQYKPAQGSAIAFARRHFRDKTASHDCWDVSLYANVSGRLWSTDIQAVTDDFGWLVEVPR